MATYNRITESEFNTIKGHLMAGKTLLEVATICGISRSTVSNVSRIPSWNEWSEKMSMRREAERKPEGAITRKKITKEIYTAVKFMLKGIASASEIAACLGISTNSVNRIRNAETFDEYVENARYGGSARYRAEAKNQQKEAETVKPVEDLKQPGGTLSGNYQINRIFEQQKQTNELLKLISDKLAYIVQQLT